MTVRNRKRGVGDLSNQHDVIDAKRSGKEELDCVIEVGQPKARKTPTLSTLVWWILHLIAVGFVAYGVILGHTKVFHHEECSMTYSWRIFLPTSLVSQTTPYRLYQFMDSRDTRFRTLMQAQKPLAGRQGCWNGTSTAILFIPGHGGDFEQSRSIGAHGMQMTHRNDDRIRRHKIQFAIQSQNFSGDVTELKNFVFPVYAADFQEEGTGLHGIFTQQQATFVAEAIQYLTESSCGYQHILIVSHSMGGHAALLAYQENTTVRRYVNNIVNLGTPHAFPVLAFDRSLYDLHQKLSSGPFYSDLAMVSISGGLRDEMIPVEACDATKMHQSNTLSLLASSVMERKKDLAEDTLDIGCDHRALVWCHNLLSSIRTIIFQLIQSQQGGLAPEHRLLQVTSQVWESSEKFPSYKELVSGSYSNLDRELGIWNALAVEIGFIHNANLLVSAYHAVGAFYAAFGLRGPIMKRVLVFPAVVFYLRRTASKPLFTTLLVLIALTSHALFWMFRYAFLFLPPLVPAMPRTIRNSLGVALILLGPISSIFSISGLLQALTLSGSILFYLSLILGSSISASQDQATFAAWTFPMLPVLLAGNIYASWKRPHLYISGTPFAWFLVSLLCTRWLFMSRPGATKERGDINVLTTKRLLYVLRYALFGWILMDANPQSFKIVENLLCFSFLDFFD